MRPPVIIYGEAFSRWAGVKEGGRDGVEGRRGRGRGVDTGRRLSGEGCREGGGRPGKDMHIVVVWLYSYTVKYGFIF